MIVGIGTDIVNNTRIRQAIAENGERFLSRLFTAGEREASLKHKDPTNFFAKRYAAKEACAKALGTGIGEKASFLDIEVFSDEKGAPHIRFSKKTDPHQNLKANLSLSDEKDFSIAFVILEQTT